MSEYISDTNYVRLHLDWIQANKSFKPKGGLDTVVNGKPYYSSYYDQMSAMYKTLKNPNKYAYLALGDDVKFQSGGSRDINKLVKEMYGIVPKEDLPAFFITFNFDKKRFNSEKILSDLAKFLQLSWIKTCHAVFENYTENGEHPHLMMFVTVTKNQNKMLDKMKESRLAKYCAGLNFIDVKRGKDYHQDYLLLEKTESKRECLEKDVIWRIENNLPHEIKK